MLAFKKWSFSLDVDLAGATVKMSNSKGQSVELNQENLSQGYGINTLVWEPKINMNQLENEAVFTVIIQLKNGKNYTYRVRFIDIVLH
jgi:hypothetical protein